MNYLEKSDREIPGVHCNMDMAWLICIVDYVVLLEPQGRKMVLFHGTNIVHFMANWHEIAIQTTPSNGVYLIDVDWGIFPI